MTTKKDTDTIRKTTLPESEYERLMRGALQAILKNSRDYIFIKDKDIICRAASHSFLHLMDTTPEKLYGYPDSTLFNKELADHYRVDDLNVINNGKVIRGEVEYAKPAGEDERWGCTDKFPVYDEKGNTIGLVGLSSDFTSQHKALEQNQNLRQHGDIINNLPIGCGISHYENGIFYVDYVNDGVLLIPFVSPELINASHGLHFFDIVCEEDRQAITAECERMKTIPDGTGNVDFRIYGRDGELHWVNMKLRRAYKKDAIQYYYAFYNDIDERKRNEEKLVEAKQAFENVVLDANLIIWNYDMVQHKAEVLLTQKSKAAMQKMALARVIENYPQATMQFVAAKDRQKFLATLGAVENGAASAQCDVKVQLESGGEFLDRRVHFKRIINVDGKLLTIQCYSQDNSELIKERERLSHFYNSLGSKNAYATFYLNLTKNTCTGIFRELNLLPEALALLEEKTADGWLRNFARVVADEKVRQNYQNSFTRTGLLHMFAQGKDRISIDFPVDHTDGSRHWRDGTVSMIKNPDTGDVEAVAYAVDIDDRKSYENILNELSGKVYNFIALIDLDTDTVTEYGNAGQNFSTEEKLHKADYTSAMRNAVKNFIRPDKVEEALKAHSIEVIRQKLAVAPFYEMVFPTKDNKIFEWRLSYIDGYRHKVLILRRDVTKIMADEHRQVEEMAAAKLEADKANQSKSNFLSNMSHDLRTPLNGILGFTSIALEESDAEKRTTYLKKIQTSGQLLLDLVNDTLELSRIESGKLVLKPEIVDGQEFWESVVTALSPSAAMKNIHLETDTDLYPKEMIRVDQLQVKKVLLNLISNAIKYTPAGGTVKVAVQALTGNEHGYTRRIIVEDNGIGMSEEFMTRMYEPFNQEQRPEAKNVVGTGLGLSIVKKIVDFMNGEIKVQSKINSGTRFVVDLPIEHWAKKPEEMKLKQEEARKQQTIILAKLSHKNVLLCEDNELNAEIATLLLKNRKMHVDWCEDGQKGLATLQASIPGYYDLVLMDVRMPVMDGYAATKAIRKLERPDLKNIPIIAMTANAFEEDIKEAEASGMNDYATKPINPPVLFATLAKYIK